MLRAQKSRWALVVLATALVAAGCGSPAAPSAPPALPTPTPPPPAPLVVIISIDGLRPDALSAERTPNILEMAAEGTACWQAQTIFPPITLPSHASMLTGFPPSVHGLTWANYMPEKGVSKVPTIFSYARAAGQRTVMVVGKDKFNHLKLDGSLDAFDLMNGDDQVTNKAIQEVQAGADLLFVHLPDVDVSGHASGWMSPQYLQQVVEADRAVGTIRAALPAHATVFLTADHGGLGSTHGMDRVQDMTIPWIVVGPDVVPDQVLTRRIATVDTAATALSVLGLRLAPDSPARPVAEAFKPGSTTARRIAVLQ